MQRVGIFYNPQSSPTERIAAELDRWLKQHNVVTWCGVEPDGAADTLMSYDLLVCLGGDGTVLRAASLAIPAQVPMLPVALGHLSFMAEVTPEELYPSMERVLAGDCWIEERALAEAVVSRAEHAPERYVAMNEVLVGRGDLARVIAIAVEVDDIPMTTYHADGVLVATATGSTAYGLAAGGPVLDPRSRALVLVPIAAHLHNVPSLVLHENAHLDLHVVSKYPAALAIDGRINEPLHPGDTVAVQRAQEVARFARVRPPSYFYQTLTKRLRREL
ncbi:MAG TPA: NAD(+)/NADH kinase [Herpetosiphonaceae bacterium]